jgi:hypothetical protein
VSRLEDLRSVELKDGSVREEEEEITSPMKTPASKADKSTLGNKCESPPLPSPER